MHGESRHRVNFSVGLAPTRSRLESVESTQKVHFPIFTSTCIKDAPSLQSQNFLKKKYRPHSHDTLHCVCASTLEVEADSIPRWSALSDFRVCAATRCGLQCSSNSGRLDYSSAEEQGRHIWHVCQLHWCLDTPVRIHFPR